MYGRELTGVDVSVSTYSTVTAVLAELAGAAAAVASGVVTTILVSDATTWALVASSVGASSLSKTTFWKSRPGVMKPDPVIVTSSPPLSEPDGAEPSRPPAARRT